MRGFTLIELIVCLFVIGLLIAMLAPAVQQAREAARATQCRSKLHQLNLAIHNYLELHQYFPSVVVGNEYSYAVKLLPQLEQTQMAADFQSGNLSAYQGHFSRPMPILLCPDETGYAETPLISYYMNYGNQIPVDIHDLGNGFHNLRPLATRDVPDGLSHTVILSEALLGGSADPREKYWKLGPRSYARGDEPRLADDCQAMPRSPADSFDPLTSGWVIHWDNRYYHFLPPNHRSCLTPAGFEARNSASRHAGMAQTAYADGSVRVTSNSIDRSVWQAMGSRNGGEVVP